jgi:sec-independent protein translocase protein TatA
MNTLALLPNLAGPDMIIIFVIVLIMFGAKKLPEFAKGLGQAVREFSKAKDSVNSELHGVTNVMDHNPYHNPVHPPVETHALPNPAPVAQVPVAPTPPAVPGTVSLAKPDDAHPAVAPASVPAAPAPQIPAPTVPASPVAASSPVPEALKPKV